MRYFKEEISGQCHKRYCFALGRDEAEIILGCLHKAHQFTPKTLQTELTIARIKQMRHEINEALKEIPEDNKL